MKKRLTVILVLSGVLFYGCKKENTDPATLEVYATTGPAATVVSDAWVKLYKVTAISTLLIDSGMTDLNGKISFYGLEPVHYKVAVNKGCLSNSFIYDHYHLIGELQSGITNYHNANLNPKGRLKIINNTPETYMVRTLINEISGIEIPADSSTTFKMDEGARTIYYHNYMAPTPVTDTIVNIQCGAVTEFTIQ